jgi:hypothetical protein
MMRGIILFAALLIASSSWAGGRKVLNRYVVGSTTYGEIMRITGETEVNVYSDHYMSDHVQRITVNNYRYRHTRCKIVFLVVNDTLRSLQYYPTDPGYYHYVKHLNQRYSRTESYKDGEGSVIWHDDRIDVEKEMTGDYVEYFTHHDRKYMKMHKNYKNY